MGGKVKVRAFYLKEEEETVEQAEQGELSFQELQSRYADDSDGDQKDKGGDGISQNNSSAQVEAEEQLEKEAEWKLLNEADLIDSEESEDYDDDTVVKQLNAAFRFNTRQQGSGNRAGGVVFYDSPAQRAESRKSLQPLRNSLQKLDNRICLERVNKVNYRAQDSLAGSKAGNSVASGIKNADNKLTKNAKRRTDKSDRATVENVLDRRTRTVLYKMLNRDVFSRIYGCVSTGKEANVYHAVTSGGGDLAIKIFKTSILVFKDRDRYVSGDFRFRNGYCKSNPRKMVQAWAEKELRNLSRLHNEGIKTAKPLEVRMHVLVMEFIGKDGVAAPRLKDAQLNFEESKNAYKQLVEVLWKLYKKCKLVHADFSEYNILYFQGDCYVIDVSQGVDLDHPHALDFLREDARHLNEFFQKQGVSTLTVREIFDFVTDPTVTDENMNATLEKLLEEASKRLEGGEDEVDSAVFQQVFIPRRLEEIVDYERDHEKLRKGDKEGIYYQTIMGLKDDMSGVQLIPRVLEKAQKEENNSEIQKKNIPESESDSETEAPSATPINSPEEKQNNPKKEISLTKNSEKKINEKKEIGGESAMGKESQMESKKVSQKISHGESKEESQMESKRESHGESRSDSESDSESDLESDPEDFEEGSSDWSGSDSEIKKFKKRDEQEVLSKEEVKAMRKAHKKAVKEQNKVKRQNKTPKKVKKRQEKKGRKNRK